MTILKVKLLRTKDKKGNRSKFPRYALSLLFIVLFAACSNCVCLDYVWPQQMQWYNTSYDGTPNVFIGVDVQTVAPKSITILESDSDQINLSLYYCRSPEVDRAVNRDTSAIRFRLWTWDNYPTVKPELFVYLPRGSNCTIGIGQVFGNENRVINRYNGGNLTLYVNDPANASWFMDANSSFDGTGVIR